MTSQPTLYGAMPDGSPVQEVRLRRGALAVDIITFGAVLRDLRVAERSVVLGCGSLDNYVTTSPHFGAVLGRFANRIARGHLEIDGTSFQLTTNNGRNHMHGGAPGFSRRNWMLVAHDDVSATLRIIATDGEQGYPGTVQATCRYTLIGDDTLEMTLSATTDAPTAVNLANHSYFNLSGDTTIDDHTVAIFADRYLPLDDESIPTGAIADVAGTRFDLRTPNRLGDARYDTPFVIASAASQPIRPVAHASAGGLALDVSSTQPSVQFYTGQNIREGVTDRAGKSYAPGAGLCFETQGFPDAPNHDNFPSAILRPGQTYGTTTLYRFTKTR